MLFQNLNFIDFLKSFTGMDDSDLVELSKRNMLKVGDEVDSEIWINPAFPKNEPDLCDKVLACLMNYKMLNSNPVFGNA